MFYIFPLDVDGSHISVGFWWFTYFRWILVVHVFPLDFGGLQSARRQRKLDKDVRGQTTSTEVACMYATDGSFQITLTDTV